MRTRSQERRSHVSMHNPARHEPETQPTKRRPKRSTSGVKTSKKSSTSSSSSSSSSSDAPSATHASSLANSDDDRHDDFPDCGEHDDDKQDPSYTLATDIDDPDAKQAVAESIIAPLPRPNVDLLRNIALAEQFVNVRQARQAENDAFATALPLAKHTLNDLLQNNSLYRKVPPAFYAQFVSVCRDYWGELSVALESNDSSEIERCLLNLLMAPTKCCKRTRGGNNKRKQAKHNAMLRNFETVFQEIAAGRASRMNADQRTVMNARIPPPEPDSVSRPSRHTWRATIIHSFHQFDEVLIIVIDYSAFRGGTWNIRNCDITLRMQLEQCIESSTRVSCHALDRLIQ